MVDDDEAVGLDGLNVVFDDERVVSDAGIVLVATLAQRLGIEDLARGLVRLGPGRPGPRPIYYIVPAWWIENSIYVEHEAYIARHGGKRARTPTSTHHAIPANRLAQRRDRWDLLRIF